MEVIFRGKKSDLKELVENPFINFQNLNIVTIQRRIKKYNDIERAFSEKKNSASSVLYGDLEIKRSIKCLPSDVQKAMVNGNVEAFMKSCKEYRIGEPRAYK